MTVLRDGVNDVGGDNFGEGKAFRVLVRIKKEISLKT